MSLMVLSAAGFGMTLSWRQDEKPGPGHKLTFTATLRAQASGRFILRARIYRIKFPDFIAKRFKNIESAYISEHELKVERLYYPDFNTVSVNNCANSYISPRLSWNVNVLPTRRTVAMFLQT
jgi:hypothetical protein